MKKNAKPQEATTWARARKSALYLFSVVLLLALSAAPVLGQFALDGFDPNANGLIRVVVVQPDGKILIGGDFTTLSPNGRGAVTRNRIARLNPDGTLDTAFNPSANAPVYSIALQADGKILVGGDFNGANSIGGQARNRIARLEPVSGSADFFNPDANIRVSAIAVQPDGKIVAGGLFTSIGQAPRNRLARIDPTTGGADAFDPNVNDAVYSIAVQADGRILAGGLFTSIGGQTRNYIARLDPVTGAPDSFNPDATVSSFYSVNAIAVQPDGKILAGGFFGPNMGGQTRFFMARLDPNTGAADSFNPSPNLSIFSIVLQADGKILIGGPFTQLSPNGGAPVTRNRLARLNPDGTLDTAFNPNASGSVYSIATQADGKILAGGEFTTLAPNGGGAVTRNRIARLETDGRLDRTLDLGLVGDSVLAAAVQPDGKILIGGLFSSVSGTARSNIARLNPDGTLDTAFNPNANGRVNSIALQADGKILVGGQFTTIGGALRNRIARVDATTGAADLSFNPNASGSDPTTVFTIAVQADGKILVGGRFIAIGGEARTNIARLDATTGSADSTFNPITNGSVVSIALQADGRILVAGAFTNIAGQPRNRIARLDPDGSADSFDPNANAPVFSLAVQADGRVLVGGDFLNIGGVIRGRIARLTPNGSVETFNPTANGSVYSLALQADGKVLVGGGFALMGTDSRNAFARLSNDTSALQNLSATQTSVTWTRGGSSPQLARVTFEYSADNANYTLLGSGTAAGSHWGLTGLNLPLAQNIYIRARGYHRSGLSNASESITESARNAFIATADPTPTPTPTATPTATPGLVANVSTRLPVGTDDNVLIEGFIVLGPNGSTKKIMVRALGPFLIPFGIPDALPNPTLEIRDASNGLIASNNDWRNTQVGGIIAVDQAAEIEGSGLAPVNDLESAIIAELSPGGYTAIVRGVNNTVGTGIVDAYDMSPGSPARLANVATRGLIQPGDQLMIAGFIIQQGDVRAVVRAIGPSLSAFGITNALPDTTLQLRDVNGAIVRENDDWQSDQKVELENTGLQPGDSREAAVVVTLPPGQYTAQVRGKPETTGIGVVEVYFLQ